MVTFLAGGLNSLAQQTTRGKDFYVGFLPNIHAINAQSDILYLYVSADKATNGVITYNDGLHVYNQPFAIAAGQIYSMEIPWSYAEPLGYNQMSRLVKPNENEIVTRRAFHIVTSEDVSVYALNNAVTTADAAVVFPTPALGNEYYVMSYKADELLDSPNQFNGSSTPSEFLIVGTQNNTVVQVYPTVPTTETGTATKTITLNAGDTWLCQNQFSTSNLNYDLSGTRIVSTKAVAVFSGHQRATVPVEAKSAGTSRDQLYEELPPTSVWGLNYIITPLPVPPGSSPIPGAVDLYRIVAAQNGTAITFNGKYLTTLDAGQVFEAPLSQAGLISATSKILVALIKQTSSNNNSNLQNGDPFMLIVPPRSQYMSNYTIMNCEASGDYNYQYITVITASSNTNQVLVDNAHVSSTLWKTVPSTCYVYAHVPVTDGVHTVTSPRLVGLYVCGYGEALSYGYVGGMSFVPDIGNDALTAGPDQSICIGDTVQLQSTGKAVSLRWTQIGNSGRFACDTCPSIIVHPSTTTGYILSGTDSLGCSIIDTVQVVVHDIPDVTISPVKDVCTDVPVTLHANGSFETIEWSPPTGLSCTSCNNPVASPGTDITYTATARNGSSARCTAVDSVRIRYRYGISKAFPNGDTICKGDSVLLQLHYGGTLRWTPANSVNCATCDSVLAFPSKTTTYVITADSADCTSQAKVTVSVVDPPTLSVQHDVPACSGKTTVLSVTTNASSVHWSPSTGLSADNLPSVVVQTDTDMVYTVTASFASTTCVSSDTIHVHTASSPTVQLSVTDTTVCASQGMSVHAGVSNTDNIQWVPSVGISCATCADVTITPRANQVYMAIASNKNGCRDTAYLNVHVRPSPSLTIQDHKFTVCRGEPVQLHAQSNQNIVWSPDTLVSCATCTDPVVSSQQAGSFVVTAHAGQPGGCETLDSVQIQINALPADTLVSDRDTICLDQTTAQLKLLGGTSGEVYQWDQSAPGLSSYTSPNPVASPQQRTTYHVQISNAAGCTKDQSITINVVPCSRTIAISSLDAGSLSACGAGPASVVLRNTGQIAIEVDSVIEVGQNGATSELDSSVHLPITVGPTSTVMLPVIVKPLQNGTVSVTLRLHTNAGVGGTDSSMEVTLSANALRYPMVVVSRSVSVQAGQYARLPVELQSDNWPDIHVHAIAVRLRYADRWMTYQDSTELSITLQRHGWKVLSSGTSQSASDMLLTVVVGGDSALDANTIALLPHFQILLSPDTDFHLAVDSVWYPNEERCIQPVLQTEELLSVGCARNLRQITASGSDFSLDRVDPNPARDLLHCAYSIAYECQPQLRIVDALGRSMNVFNALHQSAGSYDLSVDISSLSDGIYYLQFQACGHDFVRSFVIQH